MPVCLAGLSDAHIFDNKLSIFFFTFCRIQRTSVLQFWRTQWRRHNILLNICPMKIYSEMLATSCNETHNQTLTMESITQSDSFRNSPKFHSIEPVHQHSAIRVPNRPSSSIVTTIWLALMFYSGELRHKPTRSFYFAETCNKIKGTVVSYSSLFKTSHENATSLLFFFKVPTNCSSTTAT